MTYNPNDMIAYMPTIGTSFWLTSITLASTSAFFYFFKGTSITFWLAATSLGRDLLACNNYALGSQITPATLNHIIPEGPFKGQSVAFWLAWFPEGRDLLAHNNFALGSHIIPATLNHIIPDGPHEGQSVAFLLADDYYNDYRDDDYRGRELLAHHNYALGSQITPATFNQIIPGGYYKGKSVAFALAENPEGRDLLTHNNCALGKLIINRRERAHRFFSLPDDIQPYFQDPKLLRQFLQNMPDRRNEIITEALEHVARLRSISRSATTCSALRSQHLNQMESTNSFDDLDSWEQHTIIGLCSLFRKKPDSNMLTCSTAVPTLN